MIICTYNRVEYLRETIDSLVLIIQQRSDVEVVVVDNNSNDSTKYIVSQYEEYIPNIRYVFEENQGLSHARNTGIKKTSGEIVVFLDDDIDIEKNYFNVLERIFEDDQVNIVGGKVLPDKILIPEWLPLKYYYLASIFDLGEQSLVVEKVMGANYAMRREVISKVGWYDPELGRKGNKLMGGEEVDYLSRAILNGYQVLYIPELIVFHKINNKLTKEYILEYAFFLGKSENSIDRKNKPLKVLAKILRSFLHIILFNTVGKYISIPKKNMQSNIKNKYALGYLNSINQFFN